MISFAVVGHESRLTQAIALANRIGGQLSVDDGSRGVLGNHLRAWAATAAIGRSWACVIEDDAEPVEDFVQQAEQALAAAPADIVSLYLGRTRPAHIQMDIRQALHRADHTDAHWITADTVAHGVAVAMRSHRRDDWLRFAREGGIALPVDELLTVWCRDRGHTVAYTVPSLVQHQDGPSLVPYSGYHNQPRTAWRTGSRDTWNNRTVPL